MTKKRDHYTYDFKVGNKIKHSGITTDPDRREGGRSNSPDVDPFLWSGHRVHIESEDTEDHSRVHPLLAMAIRAASGRITGRCDCFDSCSQGSSGVGDRRVETATVCEHDSRTRSARACPFAAQAVGRMAAHTWRAMAPARRCRYQTGFALGRRARDHTMEP